MSSSLLRGIKTLEESEFFSASWYSIAYPDVAISGLPPAEHYYRIGGLLGRDPGPKFNTRAYLEQHPDVAMAGVNALYHYESCGRKEGRAFRAGPGDADATDPALLASLIDRRRPALPEAEARAFVSEVFARRLEGKPVRLDKNFDAAETRRFVDCLASLPAEAETARAVKVTVVMPTYNRADKVAQAIRSALDQSHENLELIIVDDGSTDGTRNILKTYESDPRVRVFQNRHSGVSGARNTGLTNATGEVIFYLDSDNLWTRDFLKLMLIGLQISKADCAYGASRLQGPEGELIGYRGEPFNWDFCVNGNYVDMNVFCHRRHVTTESGLFDTTLKRMVDWDLILRYTKERGAIYCPVIGCIYLEDSVDSTRITTSQPYAFRKIVHEKNLKGHANSDEAIKSLKFNIALKIPAPYEVRAAWGDYHYAESLKAALTALGHRVRIDFHGKWYDSPVNSDDLAIVLRGLTEYIPRPGQLSLMWNISHPDQISYEEYKAYHGIFVASDSYAALLSKILDRDVQPLLQCSDTKRFGFTPHTPGPEDRGVFVGNSRKEYRALVKWSVDSGLALDVWGQHWEPFIPAKMIKGQNIDNTQLHKTYASAAFVLNDHWTSMRDFGFVSNRIFDALSCGGRLVSDALPSIPALFGDAVICVQDEADFRVKMQGGLPPYPTHKRKEIAAFVHKHHSFDARAAAICAWIRDFLGGKKPPQAGAAPASPRPSLGKAKPRRRVGLFLQPGKAWPTSSAFIRLIAPLTTDRANTKLDVVYLNGVDDPQIDSIDRCIVQRVAVPEITDARRLTERLESRHVPLYVDTDDAFFLHAAHFEHDKALRHLMAHAAEAWFSTETLAGYYSGVAVKKRVILNGLDPRFWRNYRKPVAVGFPHDAIRFVYMGTATHDEDFKLVYPAFEQLARRFPGRFNLTLLGAVRQPPRQPWISHLLPPSDQGSYPKFIRWLMTNASFDVGIAPLQDSQFNRAKSDVKFLDYSAMGLLSLVSECPAYQTALQRNLAVGCAAGTSEWYRAMAKVIETPAQYLGTRKRALDYVWKERSTLVDGNPVLDILAE